MRVLEFRERAGEVERPGASATSVLERVRGRRPRKLRRRKGPAQAPPLECIRDRARPPHRHAQRRRPRRPVLRPRANAIIALACTFELAGVIAVGTASVADPAAFTDETVWSQFGSGYGFVPLLLPLAGLAWVWRRRLPEGEPA